MPNLNLLKYDLDLGYVENRRDFQVKILTKQDKNEMIKILVDAIPEEPMYSVLDLDDKVKRGIAVSTFDFIVPQGYSIGITEKHTSKFIGFQLNKLVTKTNTAKLTDHPDYPAYALQSDDALMTTLCDVLDAQLDTEYFYEHLLWVDPEYHQLGIGGELISISERIAKSIGGRKLGAIASSAYSAKVFRKNGWEFHEGISYSSIQIPGSEQYYSDRIRGPHTHIRPCWKYITPVKL